MNSGKWLKIIVLFVLVLSLAACGSNNSSTNSGNSGNNTEKTSKDSADNGTVNTDSKDETFTISWLSYNPPETNDTPVQKALEEKFNVKFQNIRVERQQYNAQLTQKLGAGDIPDVIFFENVAQYSNFVNQGVIAELPMEEINEAMPGYLGSLESINPNLLKTGIINDKNYSIPVAWIDGELPFLAGYNKKWMTQLGYSESPKTLDEFEELLRKMRNEDPDGNGQKDTYGYSAQGVEGRSFTTVFGAFRVRPDWMADENGKIYNGVTTDNYREALKVLNKWYKEDLIDKEFITKNVNDVHNDFTNNKVGIRDWMSFQFHPELGIIGNQFSNTNPGNEIIVGKPLTGPYGEGWAYSYSAINGFIALGKQVEENPAKKARILEVLKALATDDATYILANFGIEGEHYEMVDGRPIAKEEYKTEVTKLKIGAGLFYGMFTTKSQPMLKYEFAQDVMDYKASLADGVTTMPYLGLSAPDVELQYPDLGTYVTENTLKFITGELNLNEDFDSFVETFLANGGQAITDAYNEKYGDSFKK